MADTAKRQPRGHPRPVLGFRQRPGRLALVVFRIPLQAYRHGKGGMLGHTFVLVTHAGRKTGQPHSTVAMVLRYDAHAHEVVICSAWGRETDWFRNIEAAPALRVETGRETFTPEQRFLTEEESLAVVADCLRQHPLRFRAIGWLLGWGDLRSDSVARDVVRTRPFVALRPQVPPDARAAADGPDLPPSAARLDRD